MTYDLLECISVAQCHGRKCHFLQVFHYYIHISIELEVVRDTIPCVEQVEAEGCCDKEKPHNSGIKSGKIKSEPSLVTIVILST